MPLIPAIRPLNAMSSTAERPIRMPPSIAATGVKSVIVGSKGSSSPPREAVQEVAKL
jgi:hypothetical protein